jgi:WD40 repeat protein
VRQPNGEFLPPYPLVVTGSRDSTIRVWRLPGKGEPEFRPMDGDKGSNVRPPLSVSEPVSSRSSPSLKLSLSAS